MKSKALDRGLESIDAQLRALPRLISLESAIARIRADLSAARFHLSRDPHLSPMVVILGGTGTGKSTLFNRILGSEIAATSFKRTFTAGPVAVANQAERIPQEWLGIEHVTVDPAQLPVRGQIDQLAIVIAPTEMTSKVTLIDTPDLDGDQPAHHAQADRAFRWADAVLFLVTPEKYQMTELLPYYRLAKRYELPAIYAMNKVQEQVVADDYAKQVGGDVFVVPRDDAGYEPQPQQNLAALKSAISNISIAPHDAGNSQRVADLMERLRDQVIDPMRANRREADRLMSALRAMQTPAWGGDVNPLTQQLQRRLQRRSVLYLMGPGRMIDRVRQVPGMLARLPRTTWDLLRSGRIGGNGKDGSADTIDTGVPDFRAALVDQFTVVQSRIDDVIRSSNRGGTWIDSQEADYTQSHLDKDLAGVIADEELAHLKQWLTQKWNATPRDTAMLHKLLKVLPGGEKLSQWSEAAPYILAIVVATHHAFFGHIDMMILGGYSLATWIGERLSNEVAARARATNKTIETRFTELVRKQIQSTNAWLDRQTPATRAIEDLSKKCDDLSELTMNAQSGAVGQSA